MSDNEINEWDSPDDDIFTPAFYADLKEDIILKEDQLVFESLRTPELHNKYLRMLYRCKERLEKEKIRHNQVAHDIECLYSKQLSDDVYKKLSRQPDPPKWLNMVLSKPEIQRYIINNSKYKESLRSLQKWEHRVQFLTKVVETINNRSFHINNAIKMLRFENGEH